MPSKATSSILCVIDFSDASLQAIQWSIPEAGRNSLHISILYTYRLDQLRKRDNVVQSKKAMDTEAVEKFERLGGAMLRDGHVSFDFHSEVGFIRDRIMEHIRKNNVVLLVMGRKVAGSESFQELITEIDVPVVIVPPKKR
jgi:nucleotide-binding universal stress UspA family protein